MHRGADVRSRGVDLLVSEAGTLMTRWHGAPSASSTTDGTKGLQASTERSQGTVGGLELPAIRLARTPPLSSSSLVWEDPARLPSRQTSRSRLTLRLSEDSRGKSRGDGADCFLRALFYLLSPCGLT
ncbi:unnamed protein product [Rangifer tarandus platyrhynchus]|uniref:Uncharacterized protein n=2 Tax=Rangifer tarandus platyrhynchus TaxID=3082113 RepID=A0ACB0DZI3_RANTA|nr:unnamed protein product [Rangifer tarandus platyrhynchus]CAI9693656.1 unnamed protein product [Rangifer tarandus platyrhynchus]